MDYIQLYIDELSHHLRVSNKDDILQQVEIDIKQKLGAEYSTQDVIGILEQMGNPRDVARLYNLENKQINIVGENFAAYLQLIKWLTICGLIGSAIGSIDLIINAVEFNLLSILGLIVKVFVSIISSTIIFSLISVAIITIYFYYVDEKQQDNWLVTFVHSINEQNFNWSVAELKPTEFSKLEFISSSIFAIIAPLVFLVILTIHPWPAEYDFFNYQFLSQLSWLLAFSVGFELIANSYRYYRGVGNLQYIFIVFLKNGFGILVCGYTLLYVPMFYIPKIVPFLSDEIFKFIFIMSIIIAIISFGYSALIYVRERKNNS